MPLNKIFSARTTDLDEVVFMQRHQNYGAYELRHHYPERIKRAYFITLGVIVVPMTLFVLLHHYALPPIHLPGDQVYTVSTVVPTFEITHTQKAKASAVQTDPKKWEVTKDKNVQDPQKTPKEKIEALSLPAIGNNSTENKGAKENNMKIPERPNGAGGGMKLATNGDKPARIVESMPEFPGGDQAIIDYFSKHINYTSFDIDHNIEGTVYVEFTVMPDGTVTDIVAVTSIGGTLTDQAVNAVKNMPHWQPGRNGTFIVPVRMVIPVKCTLHN